MQYIPFYLTWKIAELLFVVALCRNSLCAHLTAETKVISPRLVSMKIRSELFHRKQEWGLVCVFTTTFPWILDLGRFNLSIFKQVLCTSYCILCFSGEWLLSSTGSLYIINLYQNEKRKNGEWCLFDSLIHNKRNVYCSWENVVKEFKFCLYIHETKWTSLQLWKIISVANDAGSHRERRGRSPEITQHRKYNSVAYHIFHEDLMASFFFSTRFRPVFPYCVCLMVIVSPATIPCDHCSVFN